MTVITLPPGMLIGEKKPRFYDRVHLGIETRKKRQRGRVKKWMNRRGR